MKEKMVNKSEQKKQNEMDNNKCCCGKNIQKEFESIKEASCCMRDVVKESSVMMSTDKE